MIVDDIVERLRSRIVVDGLEMPGNDALHREAADEIEQAKRLIYELCNAVAAFSPVAADQWREKAERFLTTKDTNNG
jgi:hypothetical protein